jgi:hypothetical protein
MIVNGFPFQIGFRGYELAPDALTSTGTFVWDDGKKYTLKHGSVVIAAGKLMMFMFDIRF